MCDPVSATIISGLIIAGGTAGAAAITANNKPDMPELPKPATMATTPQDPGKIKYGAEVSGANQQNRLRKGKTGLTIPVGTSTSGSTTGAPSTGVGY